MRALALALLLAGPLGAAESILRFHSLIEVQPDGGILVTETIKVRAEGVEIRRGIFRDLPEVYDHPDWRGLPKGLAVHRTPLKVLDVRWNGGKTAWHQVGQANGRRIYIGQAETLLEHGEHEYQIRYRYDRILKHLPDGDELYWNVTGNGWSFAILESEAEVRLPRASKLRLEAYSGYDGEQGLDYRARDLGQGRARFQATRGLSPREGLTIVLGFEKGVVAPPSFKRKLLWQLNDAREPLLAGLGAVAVWALLFFAWLRHGTDPEPRPIVPRYYPPRDLPPAALRYLELGQNDDTGFVASLLDLGVHGRLSIKQEKKRGPWIVERLSGEPHDDLGMAADRLFKPRSRVHTDSPGDVPAFRAAVIKHRAAVAAGYRVDVAANGLRLLPAVGIALLVLLALALSAPLSPPVFFAGLFATLAAVGMGACWAKGAELWRPGRGLLGLSSGWMAMGIFALIFSMVLSAVLALGLQAWWTALFSLGAGAGLGFFIIWMPRPSLELTRLREEIAGFVMYLSKAELPRLKAMNPPDETPELFEKYLPYALALGVLDRWTQRFSDVLARAHYEPGWVSTPGLHGGFNARSFSSLGSDLSTGFAGSISSASAPPSSSGSGGGGGGSSGGGGGGGGGGGW